MTEEAVEQNKNEQVIRPAKEWPGRLKATLFTLFFMMFFAALIIILKNDLVNKKIEETENLILDYAGTKGFGLGDIIITGRNRTSLEEIVKVLDLKRGDNLLKVNVRQVKRDLETLPWVRDVDVYRSFFPNVLRIDIKEKEVMALWQLNERFYPIDMDGYVIEANYKPDRSILLVIGAGAAENIIPFLKMIKKADKQYLSRIKVANYISQRRWNVILDDIQNGITVKLPEEGTEEAWNKLLKLDTSKGILKRKLTIIDLRLSGKVIVKLRKTKARQSRAEQDI